jgi:FtsH-binding integral membrane protein
VKDGVKFCPECGATLNAAAVQRDGGEQIATGAGNAALLLGSAARKARLAQVVSEDQVISTRGYNAIMLGVLFWGLLVNVVLCATLGDVVGRMNPIVFTILYVVVAFAGILIAGYSDKPLISFLGYNMVVIPFGLVISALVDVYGGLDSEIVTYAFIYTMVITLGMTGAALAFPNLFAKLGGALLGVLIGLALCEIILLLFGVSQSVTDWIAAGLFSLYIGYDIYRSQQFPKTVDNAVDCALDIYLDIANLFIRILRLMAKKDD